MTPCEVATQRPSEKCFHWQEIHLFSTDPQKFPKIELLFCVLKMVWLCVNSAAVEQVLKATPPPDAPSERHHDVPASSASTPATSCRVDGSSLFYY